MRNNNVIEGADLARIAINSPTYRPTLEIGLSKAMGGIYSQLGGVLNEGIPQGIINYVRSLGWGDVKTEEAMKARALVERSVIQPMNKRAARVRDLRKSIEDSEWLDENSPFQKSLSKATLDVASLTNFANVTGGQALGYVSLDTRMARGTIRPASFTLYQALDKSLAWQIVDFWALAKSTGGNPPGSAFANYSNVSSGALTTNSGTYDLLNLVLKLAVDGRAITTALAAQNNYINISEQETANAALNILSSFDWASYHGRSDIFSSQFDGITKQLFSAGFTNNLFDFYQFSNNYATAHSWSPEQTLYNLIYEASAQITGYATFGHITHAFMDPATMGDLQSLATTILNNIVNQLTEMQDRSPVVVNGNLIGMQTRFGHIQFPMDLLITSRDKPVGAVVVDNHTQCLGDNIGNPSSINNPTSVAGAVVTGANALGSEFSGSYTPGGGGSYAYCVVSCDSSMNETLPYNSTSGAPTGALGAANSTYSALVSGVTSGSAVQVTITPNGSAASAFRVFRSGLGGVVSSSAPVPNEFRYIGSIAANGSSAVVFTDLNGGVASTINGGYPTRIPGSTEIFLLDMDPQDLAIDFRLMLPLVRVELFASNLFMPWAVAAIGTVRLRVPQFHGVIRNFVPTKTDWNPLAIN